MAAATTVAAVSAITGGVALPVIASIGLALGMVIALPAFEHSVGLIKNYVQQEAEKREQEKQKASMKTANTLIDAIEKSTTFSNSERIFRKSPEMARKEELEKSLNDPKFNLDEALTEDPDAIALLLKEAIGESKLFEDVQMEQFIEASGMFAKDQTYDIKGAYDKICKTMPQEKKELLNKFLKLVKKIADNHEKNKMTPNNLGIIIASRLVPHKHFVQRKEGAR